MSIRCTARLTTHGLVAALPLMLLAGCSGSAGRIDPPAIDPAGAGAQAMQEYDTNHDGAIAGPELDKAPALKYGLKRLDPSGAGRVTAEAIAERIKAWGRTALMQAQAKVTMDGQPLADAEVKFVPETFLGPNVAVGVGKTDSVGIARISGPPVEKNGVSYTGVNCGYYRIEVSKQQGGKEIVPDRFNAHTTFGIEIAIDNDELMKPIELNLTSK